MTHSARWFRRGLAVLVLVGAGALAWSWWRSQSSPPTVEPPPPPPRLVRQPVALAPGVYLLGESDPSAVYAVDTSDGLVLIDSGVRPDAAGVTAQLAALHLDVGRLRAVLLTHCHGDHSRGAEHLRRLTGAKVYAGRGDCPTLRAGGPREALFSFFHMPGVVLHPTTVDVELAGDEQLQFGEARFTVLATPGHTPGSVCYLLERPGLRALFTGDVIVKLMGSGEDNLGTYSAYLAPAYGGNCRDFLASLRRLRELPTPDLVLPGHPGDDRFPQDPHLTAERWQAVLDKGIAEMERLQARYDADGANFLDGRPKQLLPGLAYLGDFEGSAVYVLDTPKGLLLFDAPGGPALVKFLAGRLKALGWEGRKPAAVLLTSADKEATAGLPALVRGGGCRVVAPRGGAEAVRALCPAGTSVLDAEEFDKAGWFEGRTIPLKGRGLAPVAYKFRRAGKTVLASGRFLTWLDIPQTERLLSDLRGPGAEAYLDSLDRLAPVRPALWLPAVPVEGQNANLYDDKGGNRWRYSFFTVERPKAIVRESDWETILTLTRGAIRAAKE